MPDNKPAQNPQENKNNTIIKSDNHTQTSNPIPTPTLPRVELRHPPLMWQQSQDILNKIGEKLQGKVVTYYTTNAIVGDDVKYFYAHLRDIGFQDKLFFILYSKGGDGMSAYRIASLLKSFCKELIIIIPEAAASAATMLTLAGDEIMMTPLSYLTAVDTSLVHPLNPKDANNAPVSLELEEIRRAVEVLTSDKSDKDETDVYKTIFNYVHPAAFGSIKRSSNLSQMLCEDILSLRNDKAEKKYASNLIDKLNREYPAHGYPITRQKAKALGLPVVDSTPDLDSLLWKLLNVYRFVTEPVRTDYNDSSFHLETYLNLIESVGRRLAVRQIKDRRLDPIMKGWTNFREEYKWEAAFMTEENGEKKLKVTNLDF